MADAIQALLDGWSAAERGRIVQAAPDGRWEDARSLAVPAEAAEVRALIAGVGGPGADVAVEFEWLGAPLVFVGARREPGATGFEDDAVRVVEADPDDPAFALALLAGGAPEAIDHVELGAANAWRSVGPLRLWTRGQAGPPPPRVAEALRGHPALARCVAPVALEVAFRRPRECWIGIEVSTPAGGVHVVDPAAVERRFARLLG
jgi:hypothetical protein